MSNLVGNPGRSNIHVDCHLQTDPDIVMAAQSAHDVVNHVRSVGDLSLADGNTSTINERQSAGEVEESSKSTAGSAVSPPHATTPAHATASIPPHLVGIDSDFPRAPKHQDTVSHNHVRFCCRDMLTCDSLLAVPRICK